jgi:hypothetical protein
VGARNEADRFGVKARRPRAKTARTRGRSKKTKERPRRHAVEARSLGSAKRLKIAGSVFIYPM